MKEIISQGEVTLANGLFQEDLSHFIISQCLLKREDTSLTKSDYSRFLQLTQILTSTVMDERYSRDCEYSTEAKDSLLGFEYSYSFPEALQDDLFNKLLTSADNLASQIQVETEKLYSRSTATNQLKWNKNFFEKLFDTSSVKSRPEVIKIGLMSYRKYLNCIRTALKAFQLFACSEIVILS